MRRRKTKNLIYRYTFRQNVDMHEIETSLLLAVLGLESLYGESRVRLEATHAMDAEGRTCVIDASSDVGRDFNRLFVGYLRREFGEDSFRVEEVARSRTCPYAISTLSVRGVCQMECEFCQDSPTEHFVRTKFDEKHLCGRCRDFFAFDNSCETSTSLDDAQLPDAEGPPGITGGGLA